MHLASITTNTTANIDPMAKKQKENCRYAPYLIIFAAFS
jgi:hypothetical protein